MSIPTDLFPADVLASCTLPHCSDGGAAVFDSSSPRYKRLFSLWKRRECANFLYGLVIRFSATRGMTIEDLATTFAEHGTFTYEEALSDLKTAAKHLPAGPEVWDKPALCALMDVLEHWNCHTACHFITRPIKEDARTQAARPAA
jgi:hypothetical protein